MTPLHLLIVEDSDDDAALVMRELRKAGYNVDAERVDSAQTLSAALEKREWDVVISDFSMPGFSGTEALRIVKEKGLDVPFIFLSGTIGEDVAVASMRNGAHDYLMKGNVKRLVPAVEREIREADRRKQYRKTELHLRQLERFETIGRLSGGIAHDFNNVIGVILALAELGEGEVAKDSKAHQRFVEIMREAGRASDLTRQLLAFARKQLLTPRNLSLNDIVSNARSLLQRLLREHTEIKILLSPDLHTVFADPTQLEQILMNLAVNARDAMPEGGQFLIETANVELDAAFCGRHSFGRPGDFVLLSISDTGIGMDAATVERIFEPFFTTKEVGKGTGLGLSTVYGVVKQHDGFINVYSEPGHGSTFRIYFPAIAEAVEPVIQAPKHSVLGGNETILIAEDNEALREVAKEMLGRLGYTVIAAEDGEQAIRLFEENRDKIALVVLDMVMPRLSGPKAFAKIIEMKPDLPVIFTTGYSAESNHVNSVVPPGTKILQKPYAFQALAEKIREVLTHNSE